MARAKLSGSLLACRDAPPAINSVQNLAAPARGTDEKALDAPVLVWLTRLKDEAAPNTAEEMGGACHRAPGSPFQATDLHPPEAAAKKPSGDAAGLDDPSPALRWPVSRAVAVAVSVLAFGSIGGLLLPPSGAKHSAEMALPIAPSTITEQSTRGAAAPELQPSAKAATVVPFPSAPDSGAENGVASRTAPQETLPDRPSTGAPATEAIVASADPAASGDASPRLAKISDDAPGANLSVFAAEPSTAPTDPPASAALNSALLERGDSLFVNGDFYTARLFYERAANAGHGAAALRLGETYDPAFLTRTRLIGAPANATIATYWYQRAQKLGVPEAEILLKAIAAETNHWIP